MLRQATRDDIPAMHGVRLAVVENRLVSTVVTEADYRREIEQTGRGWVIVPDARVVGFAIGNGVTGNIWALFVEPGHDHRGYGRQLHDAMVRWLWTRDLDRLSLTTAPGTRAERFYEAAGWTGLRPAKSGELRFEWRRPSDHVGT